ncbi:hypothetical protein FOZ62_001222, partial [Perkinsus olseni]
STCEDANFCRFMGAVVPLRRRGISMFDMRITQKLSGPGPAIPCTLPGRDDALDRYLNQKEVQRKLGVNKRFQSGSPAGDFGRDALFPFETLLPELLEAEIRVLLFDGDQDFVCNWIGFERVANEIDWPGRAAFVRAPRQEYETDPNPENTVPKKSAHSSPGQPARGWSCASSADNSDCPYQPQSFCDVKPRSIGCMKENLKVLAQI